MKAKKGRLGLWGALLALVLLVVLVVLWYPGFQEETEYPVRYEAEIRQAAQQFELDPRLVLAIARTESGFRPKVRSSVGAIGLMQVMPETGEWIADKFDERYSDEMLEDPATNLRYGCWYLRYLFDRFGEDLTLVLAAYNAGGGNVSKWLKNPEYSQDGATLSYIPNKQPREYVVKVKKAYEAYKRICPS